MYSVIETPTFRADADRLWSEDERLEFIAWLAANPDAGDVIRDSGGCRKVRWSRKGSGKRGGLDCGEIWLLLMYSKSRQDTIPAPVLKQIRKELEND